LSTLETYDFAYRFPSIDGGPDGQIKLAWGSGEPAFNAKVPLDTNTSVHRVRTAALAFTAEECRRVIEVGDALPKMAGLMEQDHRERYRDSQVAWMPTHPDTHWMYHKLAVLFNEANAYFDFELLGFVEPPQYTVYGAGQHFDWHIDVGGGGASVRKLSMTVQLSDGSEYEGGDLEFHEGSDGDRQRALGTATIFPSFIAHRVRPIVSGVRRSLVAWACGPSFR
jgi:PKHD-type hydroxylase